MQAKVAIKVENNGNCRVELDGNLYAVLGRPPRLRIWKRDSTLKFTAGDTTGFPVTTINSRRVLDDWYGTIGINVSHSKLGVAYGKHRRTIACSPKDVSREGVVVEMESTE